MKTTKSILSFILAVMMLFSVACVPAFAEEAEEETTEEIVLTDLDFSTREGKAVERLVSRGIINGYPDGTFRPTGTITRAELCVVMVKFEDLQSYIDPNAMTGFEDLDTDENYAWARPYVSLAVSRGIINGFEDGTFRAADPVTYEQAIKMIVCALGYEEEARPEKIPGDWSSGYISMALNLRVTLGTSINKKTEPTTRGVVAILVNNALDAEANVDFGDKNTGVAVGGDTSEEQLGYEDITGVVTGTYITGLTNGKGATPKNHVMIGDDIYEVGFSRNPNEYLGCRVDATIVEATEMGDYDKVVNIDLDSRTDIVEIEADLLEDYVDNTITYLNKKGGRERDITLSENYVTIYNNKYYDYDMGNLLTDLKCGNIQLIDNNGDRQYDVVKINSYDVFVVDSVSRSSQKIKLMYGAEYEGDSTLTFPEESTSVMFSLTRNGKEITFSNISKWDVLNIKASPKDGEGRRYYEVIVTRESVSGPITEREDGEGTYITIGEKEYEIAESFLEYVGEDKPELNIGDIAQVYLDNKNRVVAAAETKDENSSEAYAYLLSLRQDSDKSDYDLEFWLYTTAGKYLQIGSASKVTIDGVKYKALDDDIVKLLKKSAEAANANYPAADNVTYQQPIIYQTNSAGLVSTIYTVLSEENEDISMTMVDPDVKLNDEKGSRESDLYYSAYDDDRKYTSSNKSFTSNTNDDRTAFKVSSSTKIIYVPDMRSSTDDYLTFSSYSKAFSNSRKYHVEAFGITSSGTASLVLIYHENDSMVYTSSSPWMIVASKSDTKNGTVIKGYGGTSYSLKSVTVDEEDGPSISAIGKGDIIRYLVNSSNKLVGYEIIFDVSNPTQMEPCSDIIEARDNRIFEVHSTSTDIRHNYPNAAFRLQYGTVTEMILDDDAVDDKSITVSSTIAEDAMGVEIMAGDVVTTRALNSSVKVFYYDRNGRSSDVVPEAELSDILTYSEYGNDATRVVTYSASATLRMIYILGE